MLAHRLDLVRVGRRPLAGVARLVREVARHLRPAIFHCFKGIFIVGNSYLVTICSSKMEHLRPADRVERVVLDLRAQPRVAAAEEHREERVAARAGKFSMVKRGLVTFCDRKCIVDQTGGGTRGRQCAETGG